MASIRQLLVISSWIIACILVIMMATGTGLMTRTLDARLQTDSQNAAATLALLVAAQPDALTRGRVLNAAFQQGRFMRLELRASDGQALYQGARHGAGSSDAPGWFTALADVSPHQAQRTIAGVGELLLILDPTPARDALWTHALQWIWLALGIGAFWALFVAALLARLREALREPAA